MKSILTTVTSALSALRYLKRGDNFSITDWVMEGEGWLFLPYTAEQIAALKPLFRTWVRTAIFSALSLPSRGGSSSHRTTTFSMAEQIAIEDAVLSSEIEQLPDLNGYIKFANQEEWRRITIPLEDLTDVAPAYLPNTAEETV